MPIEDILTKIENSKEDIVRDLSGMIKIPSMGPANNGTGESACADYLMTLLDGFDEIKRVDVEDVDYPDVIRPNILAVKKGKKKKHIANKRW